MRLAALWLAAVMLGACRDAPDRIVGRFQGHAQGTLYHVQVVVPPDFDLAALQREVERELVRIDRLFSNWREDSVVERFNTRRTTAPVEVGPELVALIEKARHVHAASRGCFDPTIDPLTALWRAAFDTRVLPDAGGIERARDWIGLERLETVGRTQLRKAHADLEIDLSGIAQGESLTRLARVVETAGVGAYSVEIGGELVVRGAKPGGRPWRIAVLDPQHGAAALAEFIEYAGDRPRSIATSGTYQSQAEIDGRRYSHIIDPSTGRPVTHNTVSVTVVHDDPALADAWSTALLCLGAKAGQAVTEGQGLAALFVQREGEVIASPGWEQAGSSRPADSHP